MTALTGTAVLGLVGGLLTVLTTIALAIAVLWSQLRRNTTAIIREENEDLRNRLRTVEQLEESCKERLSELEATTSVLKDMVTGTSAVAELATAVAFNHAEILRRLDHIESGGSR